MAAKSKYLYSEAKLAEVTGISRTSLVTFRHKSLERSDWRKAKKGKGRAIELSQKAVEKVLGKFGIKDAELDGARIKGSSESQPALDPKQETQPVEAKPAHESKANPEPTGVESSITSEPELKLVKVSKLVSNVRIVVTIGDDGEYRNVIVPHSGVWALEDQMKIRQSPSHKGFWELVGKSPRRRGDRLYRQEFTESLLQSN